MKLQLKKIKAQTEKFQRVRNFIKVNISQGHTHTDQTAKNSRHINYHLC